MRHLFAFLALVGAALALWILVGKSSSSEVPPTYSAWIVGVLMGMALAWLANPDWRKAKSWMRLQRRRLAVLILVGLLASVVFLF
ncbi:MAG TPA: hypothetical protein VG758_12015 [Hyphomicrobiaceae bacterium]|jgi:hypothetical protein|nr:hypothetical protein [Hyphomicrobiaceae bacterium]